MSKTPSDAKNGPPSNRSWPVYFYIAALIALLVSCIGLTVTGAALPGPDSDEKISLRNVHSRRSHYFHYYAFGK